MFGWRACLEILPTRVNLARRRIIPDNMCHCCKRFPETGVHVLWECYAAQDVWAGSLVRIQKIPSGQSDTLQLFEELMVRLTKSKFELFFVQAWLIWNQRNTVIHGGSLRNRAGLTKEQLRSWRSFINLTCSCLSQHPRRRSFAGNPLQLRCLK